MEWRRAIPEGPGLKAVARLGFWKNLVGWGRMWFGNAVVCSKSETEVVGGTVGA